MKGCCLCTRYAGIGPTCICSGCGQLAAVWLPVVLLDSESHCPFSLTAATISDGNKSWVLQQRRAQLEAWARCDEVSLRLGHSRSSD
jgi:hypothetical protein